MSKVTYLSDFRDKQEDLRDEREESETCALWDEFHEAATSLYTWRDYESLAHVLEVIERVKTRIER